MPILQGKNTSFLKKALVGIASVCVRRGLRFQDMLDPLKEAFVTASKKELIDIDQPINVSKLAAMTGLQRRDVQRLLNGEAPGAESVSVFSKIINAWISDKNFSSKGKPRLLEVEGANSEFAKLVASVSKDISSYTVLFELERMKLIAREGSKIRLIYDIFFVTEEEGLEIMADDIKDLALAVNQNLLKENSIPNLHISTKYDNLALSKLEQIREWLLREGATFHARAREYLQQYDKDLNPDLKEEEGGGKVMLTAFSRIVEPKKRGLSNEKN